MGDKTRNLPRGEPRAAQRRRSEPEAAYNVQPGRICASCSSDGTMAEGAEGVGEWWCRQCWRDHDIRWWFRHRINHFEMPTGFRSVPFEWKFCTESYDCIFLAGFAGCAPVTNAHEVRPQLAYCVLNKGRRAESKVGITFQRILQYDGTPQCPACESFGER